MTADLIPEHPSSVNMEFQVWVEANIISGAAFYKDREQDFRHLWLIMDMEYMPSASLLWPSDYFIGYIRSKLQSGRHL